MSRYIKESNKALSGLKVVTSDEVFKENNQGKVIKSNMVFGEVRRNMPNFIVKEKKDKSFNYVDDVSELPKRTKKQLVDLFNKKTNKGYLRKVAYLVKTESSIPKKSNKKK